MLEERFTEPAGWQWATLTPRDKQTLRYGWVAPKGAVKGIVIILPGLSEYCEKYFETARDLLARGFATIVTEWRGQGLSWRHLSDRNKRYHDDFTIDVADITALLHDIDAIPALARLPRMLLAHSMGGNIALRLAHDWPDAVNCIVATSPMLGINAPFDSEMPLRMAADLACRAGLREHYAPGGTAWTEAIFSHNLNLLSTDPHRREMQIYWLNHNVDLRMGGLTYGWMQAAFATTKLTRDHAYLAKINTPVLIAAAGHEMIVSNTAIRAGCKAMSNAELLEVDNSLHEILMERDDLRNQFWRAFDAFVAKHMKAG